MGFVLKVELVALLARTSETMLALLATKSL